MSPKVVATPCGGDTRPSLVAPGCAGQALLARQSRRARRARRDQVDELEAGAAVDEAMVLAFHVLREPMSR